MVYPHNTLKTSYTAARRHIYSKKYMHAEMKKIQSFNYIATSRSVGLRERDFRRGILKLDLKILYISYVRTISSRILKNFGVIESALSVLVTC